MSRHFCFHSIDSCFLTLYLFKNVLYFFREFFQRKVYLVIIRLSKKIQYIISYIRFFGDKKQKRKDVLLLQKLLPLIML